MPKVSDSTTSSQFLSKFRDFWLGRVEAAQATKKPFQKVADACYGFFRQSSGFMWEGEFYERHLKKVEKPKFAVTLQKAFELVALFGPYLFWQYPHRRVMAREPMQFPPELFIDPGMPGAEAAVQQLFQQQQMEEMEAKYRALLMERYLNYSQREQPGGLAKEAQFAITEALIKGRGVLWPEKYSFPGDNRVLTGLFYDTVDNLLIDPDCKDPMLRSAKYIIRKHVNPYWEIERRFNLPKDSLKGKGEAESHEAHVTESRKAGYKSRSKNNQTSDLIVWYEVFSKMGVGTRDSKLESSLHAGFEKDIGDFAYVCVTKAVPYPLNLPPEKLRKSSEEVSEALAWPCPCYADHRWPVALLDFYPDPNSAWPIAPLGPALGELICMNIIVSAFLENAYENRKQIISVFEHAAESIEESLKSSESPIVVKIRQDVHKSVRDCVEFLNRPEMNNDPLKALDWLSASFDKRTGLSEFLYAMSSTQSRSATDIRSKEEKASIRPEKMANDVAEWISEASQIEKFIATIYVNGEDLQPLLGTPGAILWNRLISNQPIDVVSREMTATVYASDIRKPNKARETDNINTAAAFVLPVLQQYATITGDSGPINGFINAVGDAIEMPTHEWQMGQWLPQPPDPAMMQQQQQIMGLEVAGKEAEVQKKQAEAMKASAEAQGDQSLRQMEFMFEQAESEADLQRAAEKHQADMAMTEEEFRQKQMMDHYEFQEKLRQRRIEGNERLAQARQQQAIRQSQKKVGA